MIRFLFNSSIIFVSSFCGFGVFAFAQDSTAQGASSTAVVPAGSAPAPDSAAPTGDANAPAEIDERFATEGYVGVYGALLQSTVPSVGVTSSFYLDDDLRFGVDLWRGQSKLLFSSFKTSGAGLWSAFEVSESMWLKGGFSYARLERPTGQEPIISLMNKMTDGKDSSDQRPTSTESLQLDVSFGQLWNLPSFSVAFDYLGCSIPFLTLTGKKQAMFNVHALRAEVLYDIE